MSDTSEPLTELLEGLSPSAGRLARDRVLFEVGRAEGRRALVGWRISTGFFACLTVLFGGWVWLRPPETQVVIQTVPVSVPEEPVEIVPEPEPYPPATEFTAADSGPDFSNPQARRSLRIRREVLRWGVDQLPKPPRSSEPVRTESPEEFREWLGLPPTPGIYASPRGF